MPEDFEFGARRWNKYQRCYEVLEDDGQENGGRWRLEHEFVGSDAPVGNYGGEPGPRAGLDEEISLDDGEAPLLFGEENLNQ